MLYLYAGLMVLLNSAWLVLGLLGLPGNWLMLGTALLLSWWTAGQDLFHPLTLVTAALLALAGEVIELAAGAMGAKKFGGTKRAAIGALLGAFIGAILGTFLIPVPVVGTIAGATAGAFFAATALEMTGGRGGRASVRAGRGAALGQITGNLTKFAIGCLIWSLLAVAAFVG